MPKEHQFQETSASVRVGTLATNTYIDHMRGLGQTTSIGIKVGGPVVLFPQAPRN